MQEDQIAESVDNLVKNSDVPSDDTGGLSLGNNPSDTSTVQPVQDSQTPAATTSTDDSAAQSGDADKNQVSATPVAPVEEAAAPAAIPPEPTTAAPEPLSTESSDADSGLDPIKKEALQKLEPLVSELDLQPAEKYRALMMIIQATDNKDLVAEAYQAANKIEDSKTRAQALLSIINEIDYFKSRDTAAGQ